ncbi:hypothetical protein Syun_030296 [Stephania yunnanensis]|uniref:Molybdopterin synthase catalytic subunit n=1 Tax=Stephania yunnanensis TaxID=152371 RepID=A0AAP0EBR1_9MAGN
MRGPMEVVGRFDSNPNEALANPNNGGSAANPNLIRHRTGPQKTLIEILQPNTPIDPSKYMGFVHSPKYGAIATFSGTTRDTFEGKSVVELRYEAYEAMAAREVGSICESARSRWDVGSVAVAHRLGSVGVGEISVFVAVSSVHRGESLDACKYLIDEIKGSVPIWKKEVYGDGEVWKENREFFEGGGRSRRMGCCCGRKSSICTKKLRTNQYILLTDWISFSLVDGICSFLLWSKDQKHRLHCKGR